LVVCFAGTRGAAVAHLFLWDVSKNSAGILVISAGSVKKRWCCIPSSSGAAGR
jgi:hypothetical protein